MRDLSKIKRVNLADFNKALSRRCTHRVLGARRIKNRRAAAESEITALVLLIAGAIYRPLRKVHGMKVGGEMDAAAIGSCDLYTRASVRRWNRGI